MPKFEYDYYSGAESEQFRFVKIPKVFFEDSDYEDLGLAECVLYGFLHEQVAFSKQNGWVDKQGKTYVIRTLESIQKVLRNCSPDKARATLNNLVEFGLIEKKRRGQGKPDLIYVKNFVTKKSEISSSEKNDDCGKLFSESEKTRFLNEVKSVSRVGKNQSLEVGNSDPINTNNNNTNIINTPSINQSNSISYDRPLRVYGDGQMDGRTQTEKEREAYAELIKDNLDYDRMMHDITDPSERKMFDDFYNLILEVAVGKTKEYKINGSLLPQEVVKSVMLKLTGDDVQLAIRQISEYTGKIHYVHNFMITTLYNAGLTTTTYITNDVQNGMYGGGWAKKDNSPSYETRGDYYGRSEEELERMVGVVNV